MSKKRFMTPDAPAEQQRPVVRISLEEEMLLAVETTQDLNEVKEVEEDITGTIDTIAVLDELAQTMNAIEEPTPETADMATLVSEAAAVGSGLEPEQLMPALESLDQSDWRVSLEGIKERAAKLWEWVKTQLQKLYQWVKSIFIKIEQRTEATEARWSEFLTEVHNELKANPNGYAEKIKKLPYEIPDSASFQRGGHVLERGDLHKACVELAAMTKEAENNSELSGRNNPFSLVEDTLVEKLKEIKQAIDHSEQNPITEEFLSAKLAAVNVAFMAANDTFHKAAGTFKFTPDGTDAYRSQPILGNKIVQWTTVTNQRDSANVLEAAALIQKSKITLVADEHGGGNRISGQGGTFDSPPELEQFFKDLKLSVYERKPTMAEAEAMAKKMTQAGEELSNALEAKGQLSGELQKYVTAIIHHIPALSLMMKGVWLELQSHYLNVSGAHLAYVQKIWKGVKIDSPKATTA